MATQKGTAEGGTKRASGVQGTPELLRNPTQQNQLQNREMEHQQKPPNNQTNQKPRTETVICNIIPANPFNAYC